MQDHCHFTGEFRGAAHQHCNLNYKIDSRRYKLPIVFHNLRVYDAHLIFQKIKWKHSKINGIPNNSERYISFDVRHLKFLYYMQFLSHDKLAEQLSNNQFNHLKAAYPEHRRLLSNGIYCYDYMNSMERFDETSLPSKDKHVSEEQHDYVVDVWETLNIIIISLLMCSRILGNIWLGSHPLF